MTPEHLNELAMLLEMAMNAKEHHQDRINLARTFALILKERE